MRKKSYAYPITYPIPHFKEGGYLHNFLLEQMALGGTPSFTGLSNSFVNSKQYNDINTPSVNTPKGAYEQSTKNATTIAGYASAIGGLANMLTPQNTNPYQANLAGKSSTQNTVDSLASMIPVVGQFYSAGKSIGNLAKSDYETQNEYGELTNTNKYIVADTIGTFIDPLGSFISGISGEGWTSKQKSDKINAKGAINRQAAERQKGIDYKNREINAGYGGNYFDQNQMMQAAYGGALPVVQNSFEMAYGGGMQPQQMQSNTSQITNYQNDMSHAENPNGGTPVDDHGNRVITSNNRPIATVEGGEISYFSKKNGSSYIFSNKIYI